MTRQDYMNGKCTHREYYGQFVDYRTRAYVRRLIGDGRLKSSTDPHFNDIPLHLWDGIVPRAPGSGKFKDHGDFYTLAGGVCMLKEAALQVKEHFLVGDAD